MFFGSRYSDLWFKDVPGGKAFYPYGRFGKGYLVDAQAQSSIKIYNRRWMVYYGLLVAVQIGIQSFIGIDRAIVYLAVPYFLSVSINVYMTRRYTTTLPEASVRMTGGDFVDAQAKAYSPMRIMFLMVAGPFMTAAAFLTFLISLPHPGVQTIVGALGTVFFSIASVSGFNIALRRRLHDRAISRVIEQLEPSEEVVPTPGIEPGTY